MKLLKSLNGQTFKYTTIASVLLAVYSLFNNYVLEAPGPKTSIEIFIKGNGNTVQRTVTFDCPVGWYSSEDDGETDIDPRTGESLIICESPDKTFNITARDGRIPTEAFNVRTGVWVPIADAK